MEVVAAGPLDPHEPALLGLPPLVRDGNFLFPGQVLPRQRGIARDDLVGRARRDNHTAMDTGTRSHVDDIIRKTNGILVMLDDKNRVAKVAKPDKRRQQPVIVTLMKADRRLVQYIEDACQARADLRCKADSLRLAAGESAGIARHRQVGQPHIHKKAQTLVDFLEDTGRDLRLLAAELVAQSGEPVARLADRQAGDVGNIAIRDSDRQRLRLQPFAATGIARMVGTEFFKLLAHP